MSRMRTLEDNLWDTKSLRRTRDPIRLRRRTFWESLKLVTSSLDRRWNHPQCCAEKTLWLCRREHIRSSLISPRTTRSISTKCHRTRVALTPTTLCRKLRTSHSEDQALSKLRQGEPQLKTNLQGAQRKVNWILPNLRIWCYRKTTWLNKNWPWTRKNICMLTSRHKNRS